MNRKLKTKNYLAYIISRIFEPIILIILLIIISVFRSPVDLSAKIQSIYAFIFLVTIPFVFLVYFAIHKHWISGIDLQDRKERPKAMIVMSLFSIISFFIFSYYGISELVYLFDIFIYWYIGFFLITLFWKISGHSSIVTIFTLMIIYWYGYSWWPVFFIIPLVSWARVVRHNHTVMQVVGGFVYTATVFLSLQYLL